MAVKRLRFKIVVHNRKYFYAFDHFQTTMRFHSKCKDLWISDFCCRQKMETTSCDFDTNQIGYPWFSLYLNPTTTTSKINNDNWIIKNLINIEPVFQNVNSNPFSKNGNPIITSVISSINPCVNGHTHPDTFFFFEDERVQYFSILFHI